MMAIKTPLSNPEQLSRTPAPLRFSSPKTGIFQRFHDFFCLYASSAEGAVINFKFAHFLFKIINKKFEYCFSKIVMGGVNGFAI